MVPVTCEVTENFNKKIRESNTQLRGVKRNAINRVVRKNDNDFDN